ncbi:UPF0755 protein [Clostridium amylolyticum]|uniref:Endolytic murein transglycosylase n=1 Tax=Clostridium amylolyticum TaxID=1121298 RepID=A0A1M6D1B7_9CLOT|nr:endolytic transglycosylase MltG [Clostridium amylolyticum]SHI66854.1 UPF0755 protein [Clostridium amylolyticum]
MRKKVVIAAIFILILLLSGGYLYYNSVINHPLKGKEEKTQVVVNKGDTLYNVLNRLDTQGKIKNISMIKIHIKLNSISGNIKPGDYEINSDISFDNLVNEIKKGNEADNSIKITIPEGFDIDKISAKIEEAGLCKKDDFIKAVKEYKHPNYIKFSNEKRYNIEGFLFPDTYSIKKDAKPDEIVDKMVKRFEEVLKECEKELNISLQENKVEETINISAMIEKEARNKEEMPTIASVINNRIDKKMPLQIDATVLYALGKHKEVVTYKDLEVVSPYNTYKIPSLPAGPIASPGKEAIKAAMAPAKTDYLYYLYDSKKGSHFFTNNYNEFLKKKKELGY